MLIPVQPEDSFDVEPGRYSAVCNDTKEIEKATRKGIKKYLRITWELAIPSPCAAFHAACSGVR